MASNCFYRQPEVDNTGLDFIRLTLYVTNRNQLKVCKTCKMAIGCKTLWTDDFLTGIWEQVLLNTSVQGKEGDNKKKESRDTKKEGQQKRSAQSRFYLSAGETNLASCQLLSNLQCFSQPFSSLILQFRLSDGRGGEHWLWLNWSVNSHKAMSRGQRSLGVLGSCSISHDFMISLYETSSDSLGSPLNVVSQDMSQEWRLVDFQWMLRSNLLDGRRQTEPGSGAGTPEGIFTISA